MLVVDYAILRDNMERCFDKVTDDYETIVVKCNNKKNVVIMSEEIYNNLIENVHLMENEINHDWLLQSKMQLEQMNCSVHTLDEDYNKKIGDK